MLDRIKKEELRFPSKPVVSDEAKDFIAKVLNEYINIINIIKIII